MMPSNPPRNEKSKENDEINSVSNAKDDSNEITVVKADKKIKTRSEKKEEARKRKRKLIEESGGVRPRPKNKHESDKESTTKNKKKKKKKKNEAASTTFKTTYFVKGAGGKVQVEQTNSDIDKKSNENRNRHRFGRVMDQAPCTNKSRYSTLSIAVPGSVVANCQTRELKTAVVGQIARAAAIYHVDEIIVFDDHLSSDKHSQNDFSYDRRNRRSSERNSAGNSDKNVESKKDEDVPPIVRKKSDPHAFMARILQYCECPQYLRRSFFPMHPDLQFAGLLHPLDAPHHVRSGEQSKYREGVVLDKVSHKSGNSLVNVGIFKTPVEIDLKLKPGIRCTVELDVETAYQNDSNSKIKKQFIEGKVVSPNSPKHDNGTYWGYTTRLASNLRAVFDECPYEESYDLKIGTSERGDVTVDDANPSFQIPHFKHALIVFGGVAGIEECVDADETMTLSGKNSKQLFDVWVNTCPFQGSRTIRTEEAVLLSLARLRPLILGNDESKIIDMKGENNEEDTNSVTDVGSSIAINRNLSYEAISDESSCDQ